LTRGAADDGIHFPAVLAEIDLADVLLVYLHRPNATICQVLVGRPVGGRRVGVVLYCRDGLKILLGEPKGQPPRPGKKVDYL
jgi:hypothetical protein